MTSSCARVQKEEERGRIRVVYDVQVPQKLFVPFSLTCGPMFIFYLSND